MRLGAIHSARMHAEGAESSPELWSNEDWIEHFSEEERLFFPLLPPQVSSKLIAGHKKFRQEISLYGKITSVDLLAEHAKEEDQLAEWLLNESDARTGQSLTVDLNSKPAPEPSFSKNMLLGAAVVLVGVGLIVSGAMSSQNA